MNNCVNISSVEFNDLLSKSGINKYVLAAKISLWQDSNGLDNWPLLKDLIDNDKEGVFAKNKKNYVSSKNAEKYASFISKRLNIPYSFESFNSAEEMANKLGKKIDKKTTAFYDRPNNNIIFIDGRVSESTVLHEFIHPLVEHISNTNKSTYNALLREANDGVFPSITDLKNFLKSFGYNTSIMELEDIRKEWLTHKLELLSEKKRISLEKDKSLFKKFWQWIKSLFEGFLSEKQNKLTETEISNMKLSDIADFIVGNKEIDLSELSSDGIVEKKEDVSDEDIKSKKHADIISDIRDVLNKQKTIYRKRPGGKKIISDIEELEKLLNNDSEDVVSLLEFVKTANNYVAGMNERLISLKEKVNNKDSLSNKEITEILETVKQMSDLTSSYNVIKDILNSMNTLEASASGEDYNFVSGTLNRINKLKEEYELLSFDLTTEWLYREASETNEKLKKDNNEKYIITRDRIRSELKLASKDISYTESKFSAAISSSDPITALVARSLKRKMFDAMNEDKAVLDDLYDSYKLNGTDDYSKYIHDIKHYEIYRDQDGEKKIRDIETKAFITKFRTDIFDKNKREFLKTIGPKPSDELSLRKWNRSYAKWVQENTEVVDNVEDIIENKRKSMSEFQFSKWKDDNFKIVKNKRYKGGKDTLYFINRDSKDRLYKSEGGYIYLYSGELIQPKTKYYYNKAYDTIKDDKYYKALFDRYTEANNALPVAYRLKHGIIPQVEKPSVDKTINERLSKENMEDMFDVTAYDTRYKLQTLEGDEYKDIPVYYIKPIPNNLVNTNLIEGVIKFSQMSNNYKHLNKIKANIEVMMDLVEKRQVAKTNIIGNKIIDPTSISKRELVKSASEAKYVNERLKNFIDQSFYGESDVKSSYKGILSNKERDMNKLTGKMTYLTALSSMAGNMTSAFANRFWGNYQAFVESLSGKDFTTIEWLKARSHYTANIPKYINDITLPSGRSKDSQLIDIYDAIQGEFKDGYGHLITGSIARKLFNSNSMFFLTNITEHQIQVSTMIATLKHKMVKDSNGNEVSLYDAYEVVDGRIRLKEGIIFSDEDRFRLMNRIHSMNKRMHGTYNEFDKGDIQRHWYGKLALMFRKHIYNGIVYRWDKENLNIETGEVEKGYWRSFLTVLAETFKTFKTDGLSRYNNMSESEKIAFHKTISDMVLFAGAVLVAAAIKGDDDDDKKKRTWFQNQTILQLRRLQQDIAFYTVFNGDTFRLLSRPTVTQSTIESWIKFLLQLQDPMDRYKRKTGFYEKGEYKLKARFYKVVPGLRSIINFMTPEEQNKIFNRF